MVNIPSGIFIVGHECKTMHKADKTGALLRNFAIWANTTTYWATEAQYKNTIVFSFKKHIYSASQCRIIPD